MTTLTERFRSSFLILRRMLHSRNSWRVHFLFQSEQLRTYEIKTYQALILKMCQTHTQSEIVTRQLQSAEDSEQINCKDVYLDLSLSHEEKLMMIKIITKHFYKTHLWIDIQRSSNSCNWSVWAELFIICHNSSF